MKEKQFTEPIGVGLCANSTALSLHHKITLLGVNAVPGIYFRRTFNTNHLVNIVIVNTFEYINAAQLVSLF